MMKTIAGISAAMAIAFMSAGAVQATTCYGWWCDANSSPAPKTELSVNNHDTEVITVAGSVANTGLNHQSGSCLSHQSLNTGTVSTVFSEAHSDVNGVTVQSPATCTNCSLAKLNVNNHNTTVVTGAISLANTGLNHQSGGSWSSQTSNTGTIYSVGSLSTSLVNYVDLSVK